MPMTTHGTHLTRLTPLTSTDAKRKENHTMRIKRQMVNQHILILAALGFVGAVHANSIPIVEAILNPVPQVSLKAGNGDCWPIAWADDDNLYAFNGDGLGFGTKMGQLVLNKLSGDSPDSLTGTVVMAGAYDGCFKGSTKSMGLTCIDGILYAAMLGMTDPPRAAKSMPGVPCKGYWKMQNATILKSLDHGKTWIPGPKEIKGFTFPDETFPAPAFISYGKDGAGRPAGDLSDKYVYLISSDYGWENGSCYKLARVLKNKMGDLNRNDYQFFKGGNGVLDESWSDNAKDAAPIIQDQGKCGMASIQYIAPLERYVLLGWYSCYGPLLVSPNINRSAITVFESPTPWGPWTLVSRTDTYPWGWYDGSIVPKFSSADGKSHVFVNGSWASSYHWNTMALMLYTEGNNVPLPKDGTNLAAGKNAKASSTFDTTPVYAADRAVDIDYGQHYREQNQYYWRAAKNTGAKEWLEVDLGRKCPVGWVVLRERESHITGYKLQAWDEAASAWKDLAEGDTIGQVCAYAFTPVETRRVRLFIVATNGNEPSILYFGVYQKPPAAPLNLKAGKAGEHEVTLTWTPMKLGTVRESQIVGYAIYRNGNRIANVNNPWYVAPCPAELTPYEFSVAAINGAGAEGLRSPPVSVSTPKDVTPPSIVRVIGVPAGANNPAKVTIYCNELLADAPANNPGNYKIDQGIVVQSASLLQNKSTVVLTTTPLSQGVAYTLTVSDLLDRASSPNKIIASPRTVELLNSGLAYATYERGVRVEDLTKTKPGTNGTTPNFTPFPNPPETPFCINMTGYVCIATTGQYKFYTDGGLDNCLVLGTTWLLQQNFPNFSSSMPTPMETASDWVELEAGSYYPIQLLYRDPGHDPTGVKVSWIGPNFAKQIIPDNVLFHPKEKP